MRTEGHPAFHAQDGGHLDAGGLCVYELQSISSALKNSPISPPVQCQPVGPAP